MERASLWVFWCVIAVSPVQAGQWALLVNGHAIHLEKSPKQKNEENWGLGIQYDAEPKSDWILFSFGAEFIDSRENVSYTLGGGIRKRYQVPLGVPMFFEIGGAGFVMTRETYNSGEPFPAVLPMASVGGKRFAVNITYVPEVDPRIIPVVFFQLKLSLQ